MTEGSIEITMSSTRPYLLRALYEWIVDNGMTPYLLVDADCSGVMVPRQYVEEGRIVLNISPEAIRALELGNESVSFSGRFGGQVMEVHVPMAAVRAIYARENGRGMVFAEEMEGQQESPEPDGTGGGGGRPRLKLVK